MIPPRITCLFHSSPSVVELFVAPASHALAGDILVECGPLPALGFALGLETPVNYPGIAGLLGGTDLGSLAHATDRLPTPIVLAPGAAAAPAATRAALALLRKPDDRVKHVTLLVPIGHARSLGAALAVADHFALAWDVSEFPHEELIDFAQWLAREHLLDRTTFKGVVAYATGPVEAPHVQRLTTLLAPLATADYPPGVVALVT